MNDRGKETDVYPANPNGSTNGIAGVTNSIGNVTIMMPHPERALKDQLSWSPEIGNYIALGFLFLITLESLLIKAAFSMYELKVDNLPYMIREKFP